MAPSPESGGAGVWGAGFSLGREGVAGVVAMKVVDANDYLGVPVPSYGKAKSPGSSQDD